MKKSASNFLKSRAAFTLIELLVVLVIVAILASLLIPGIQSMIYQSKRAKSIGNLRQMGSALMTYVADNDGKLIEGALTPLYQRGQPRPQFWYNVLDAYMGGSDYTPEGQKTPERPAWQNDPLKIFKTPPVFRGFGSGVGYGWNYFYFGYESGQPTRYGWGSRLSQVEQPAQTIIIGTSTDDVNSADALKHSVIYSQPGAKDAMARRYKGGGLYLLLDGHVAAFTPEEIVANDSYLFKKEKPEINNP